MTAPPPRVFFIGRVHGPGKRSEGEVVNVIDDMLQHELDALDLRGLPLTERHPDNQKRVGEQPDLIRGQVVWSFTGESGAKYITGYIDTSTFEGCRAAAGLNYGDHGLSLGHLYTETQNSDGEILDRAFVGDHVALCSEPRRADCWVARARATNSYLESPRNIYEAPADPVITSQPKTQTQTLVCADRSSIVPTRSASASASMATPMDTGASAGAAAPAPQPAAAAAAPQQAGAGGHDQDPVNMLAEYEKGLMNASAEIMAHKEKAAADAKALEELNAKLAAADARWNELEKQKEVERQRKAAEAEKVAKKTAEGLSMFLNNIRKSGAAKGSVIDPMDESELSTESIMQALFPSNLTTDADLERHQKAQRTVAYMCNASANYQSIVEENERLRSAVFKDNGGNPPKRPRVGLSGYETATSSNMGSSSSSSSSTPGTGAFTYGSAEIQAEMNRLLPSRSRIVTGPVSFSSSDDYSRLAQMATAARLKKSTRHTEPMYPPGYKPLV